LLLKLAKDRDLPHAARFRFTTIFLEVKHGNTTAQANLFSSEFLDESEAGPPVGEDE
jgi:hypothetical protein